MCDHEQRDEDAKMLLCRAMEFFISTVCTYGKFEIRYEPHGFELEFTPQGNESGVFSMHVGENGIAYVNAIVLPPSLRKQGIGLALLKHMYEFCRQFGRPLVVYDAVPSYYARLVSRGGTPLNDGHDSVEISSQMEWGRRR